MNTATRELAEKILHNGPYASDFCPRPTAPTTKYRNRMARLVTAQQDILGVKAVHQQLAILTGAAILTSVLRRRV